MPRERSGIQQEKHKKIAQERIEILFSLAEKEFTAYPERAQRHIAMAKKIALRFNVRIPRELRRKMCKKCHSFLKPGTNATVRTARTKQAVIVRCGVCGHVMRFPYRQEKHAARQH